MRPCPIDGADAKVLETRTQAGVTRRRYECLRCARRWSTVEVAVRQGKATTPNTLQLPPADHESVMQALRVIERLLENGLAAGGPRRRRSRARPDRVAVATG